MKKARSCELLAEKEGFEPSRQSPQPTPLAGEPLTANLGTSPYLNDLAEREGFEPPRQSPQPTPLAG